MIKYFKKTTTLIILFGIFFVAAIWFLNNEFDVLKNVYYNQEKEALAAEEKPIVCRKQTEVKFPIIPGVTIDASLGPNEFEIPIGEATDMTESIAERVMTELQKIIDNSILEAASAGGTLDLAGQCGISRCTTRGCESQSYDCEPCLSYNTLPDGTPGTECQQWSQCSRCDIPPCGGQACPAGIEDKAKETARYADLVAASYNKIRGILINWKTQKPVGFWWIPFCGFTLPGMPECSTEKGFVLKELERARSGDYEILGGWERRPPGLNECVLRPEDIEAVLKGEKTGKYLSSCKEAVAAGFMEAGTCYGYQETEAGRTHAENYYCCE